MSAAAMYTLRVFYPGETAPHETVTLERAADVLTRIPRLLEGHGQCEKVVVFLGPTRLFAVDCSGNRLDE